MEELNNLEGIGMDRDFIDMESDTQVEKPKRPRKVVDAKPIAIAKSTTVDKVKMFMARCNGDANYIAAQLGINKAIVEQIIRDENL